MATRVNLDDLFGSKDRENKEDEYYDLYLDEAIQYANGNGDGIKLKAMTGVCSNVAKIKQSRSSSAGLKFKVHVHNNKINNDPKE